MLACPVRGALNLRFINICNQVKGALFAAPPQIDHVFEQSRRRLQSNQTD
jgi:hypothetical protein